MEDKGLLPFEALFQKKLVVYFLYISFQSYRIYIRRGSLICVALEIAPLF